MKKLNSLKFSINNFSKYLLLFTVLFILFIALLTAWSVFISLNLFKSESVRNNSPIVTVEFDINSFDNIEAEIGSSELILPTKEDYEKIAKLKEVKSYEINLIDLYLSPNLLDVSNEAFSEFGMFSIKGLNDSVIFDEELKNIQISEGRMINIDEIKKGDNKILISEVVAKKNKLNVGDYFTLQIANPENPEEIYEQEIQVIGIFRPDGKIGTERFDSQNLSIILEDILEYDHAGAHNHDHELRHKTEQNEDTMAISHTEFDNIKSLQETLLVENLNTIYMANVAAERISKKVGEAFNSEISSTHYQAAYILNSPKLMDEFISKAQKLLPDNFTMYGIDDAYHLWMPNTTHIMIIVNFIVLFLLIFTMIVLILLIMVDSFKNKKLLFQYLFLGKGFNDFFKVFFKKSFIWVSIAVFAAIILAPILSREIIFRYIITSNADPGIYFSIQNLSRNLIDMSLNLTDYATWNKEYLIGAVVLYIVSILLVGITIHFTKKSLLRGVLV